MKALALVLAGLLLGGCAEFMDGFCARNNKPGGYCETSGHAGYPVERAPRPVYVPAPTPDGGVAIGDAIRNGIGYATQNPMQGGGGTLCTPVPDATARGGLSVWCR
jgi:hypothetical protein